MEKDEDYLPLYETKQAKGRFLNKLFSLSMFFAIFMVWVYRVTHIPSTGEEGRWFWVGLFGAELWFGLYWILTISFRWNVLHRRTFKDRLLARYKTKLPKVDIFVCTADPLREPPIMVINTVLSVMAYDYPPEKLNIYLSDDGCSILTFYALFEASNFSKYWLPYCRKYNVQPRCPAAYFSSMPKLMDANHSHDFESIKEMYEEMRKRIETSTNLGKIPEEIYDEHQGFSRWKSSYTSKNDHDTILELLIDDRYSNAKDVEGCHLPILVYLAREKRPQHFHNFKAGAMNALIRVSSKISNGPIILNVDCDMYSNNSQSIQDALCFFMDEKSQGIAFVQFPQVFENITKNDLYGASLLVLQEVALGGLDGLGGMFYIGTGCFHQREILCGRKYSPDYKAQWKIHNIIEVEGTVDELQEKAKTLASCTYDEMNSQWGREIGFRYGCAVEDILTGLGIHCKGWKSVSLIPKRAAFLGLAPTTLIDTLVQHHRWTSGWLEIILYHSHLLFTLARLNFGLLLGYLHFNLWACNCFATIYFSLVPTLSMLKGISLYPKISIKWFLPFVYIILAETSYNLGEYLYCGGTILGWWNEQRMWLYKQTSAFLFAVVDTLLKLFGFGQVKFVITSKVANEDVLRRYENEIMEFGVDSSMFVILEALALVNIFSLFRVIVKMVKYEGELAIDSFALQILLCCLLVLVNLPLCEGVLIRRDDGKMPILVTLKATFIAVFICSFVML